MQNYQTTIKPKLLHMTQRCNDRKSTDHKDAQIIFNTWSSIHGVFGKAIDDEADKEFVRCVCQEKKGDSCGRAAERTQKWQFLDIMSFLDNYVEE